MIICNNQGSYCSVTNFKGGKCDLEKPEYSFVILT